MSIQKATARYEAWLRKHLRLIQEDLDKKHEAMAGQPFPFLRATYYRWAKVWPQVCAELASAPKALAVGDLHVENFGTWRDAEGRLVWGINDFDEAWRLAYTNDLVRLAASANLAIAEEHLGMDPKHAAKAMLEGYQEGLKAGGRPFVLAEGHRALRETAVHRLKDPEAFWKKLEQLRPLKSGVPAGARKAMARLMPERGLPYYVVHRVSGLGSLGRQRFVAIAEWHGGKIAREAKALAPSACLWAADGKGPAKILYQENLDRACRCPDPFVRLKGRWIVRRLAPDCSRIELAS
ncbi:MAG: DUF2252 family protein, partial [Acidobacteria bacterium]|nr:DUF2252 family protein [Acidobacteriota bacterium]